MSRSGDAPRESGEDYDEEDDGIGAYMFGNKEDLKELGLDSISVSSLSYVASSISKTSKEKSNNKSTHKSDNGTKHKEDNYGTLHA